MAAAPADRSQSQTLVCRRPMVAAMAMALALATGFLVGLVAAAEAVARAMEIRKGVAAAAAVERNERVWA